MQADQSLSQFMGICEYSNTLEGFSICFPARYEIYEDVSGLLCRGDSCGPRFVARVIIVAETGVC